MKYLTPDDPDAFRDYPMKVIPRGRTICPKCKGHGGWNLALNVYEMDGSLDDTPINRHHFAHERVVCTTCWGFGYLQQGQTCAHEWDGPERIVGRCLKEWTCSKCGMTRVVDSSD